MFLRFRQTLSATAILGLLFVFVLSIAWAVNYYSASQVIGSSGGSFYLVNDGPDKIRVTVKEQSLDGYLADEGINEVPITADLEEEWISTGGGTGYYRLRFTFGPVGAYFSPDELELTLKGKYAADNPDVTLFDENGEALESTTSGNSDKITFFISHLSSYIYDAYY